MKLWEEYNITEEQVKSLRLPWEVYHGHATVIYPEVEGLRKKMMVYVVRYDEGYTYFRLPVFIDDQLDQVLLSSDCSNYWSKRDENWLPSVTHSRHP